MVCLAVCLTGEILSMEKMVKIWQMEAWSRREERSL